MTARPGAGGRSTDETEAGPALRPALRRAAIATVVLAGLSLLAAVIALGARNELGKALQVPAVTLAGLVLVVVAFATLNYAIRIWRFVFLARRLGLSAGVGAMSVFYVAGFALTMSPGKVGEMARLWFLKRRYGFDYRRGVALQLGDRIGDVYAMLLLCLAGLAGFEPYRGAVLAVLLAALAGTALLVRPRLLVAGIGAAYGVVRRKPRLFVALRHMVRHTALVMRGGVFVPALALGVVSWLAEAVSLWLVLHLLGTPVDLLAATFVFAFAAVAGGLTMAPGGVGGFEIVMVMLLGLQGVPTDMAVVATAVVRLGTVWYGTVAGFLAVPVALRMSAPPSAVPAALAQPTI
ncbi:lysylphosphatidylglycerol synthase transmembrane domain-containing protein [Rhodoplanes serenus]|uniref:lysylphosphatidylglycerol synthase transmembrane domain-containing protein n=1 Tax=Rhodoplanes serenus TaxID=200615 RepID=UPI000DAC1903|nr:lysylphosphatidylglycerol synthase transmembrane domain-containing protein [Rhodoplanes serenus]RAI35931.1 hypothetical protein CH340_04465 [Rhodoplanes serenus]